MNCKIFQLQLSHLEEAPGPASLPPDMQAHLVACDACRHHVQLYQQMLSALENDATPALPADFTAKVLGRLEAAVAPSAAKSAWSWKRLAVYTGYAATLVFALWFTFKSIDWTAVSQLLHSPLAQRMQQWLVAIGLGEVGETGKNFLTQVLAFIPISLGFLEKAFGKAALPRAVNLGLILLLTFTVAKISVLLESWLRQFSRRSW